MYPCLCCGNKTLPNAPRDAIAYICPICWWENDVFISSDDEPSEENHLLTLNQARKNVQKCGICCPNLILEWAETESKPWTQLILMLSARAQRFEIHCWHDETEEVKLALSYGHLTKTDWTYGYVVVGQVTEDFKHMLSSLSPPADTEPVHKKTPFFSIFFDNGFSSEHYGTEINYC